MKTQDFTMTAEETANNILLDNFLKAIAYHGKEEAESVIWNLLSNLGSKNAQPVLTFMAQVTAILEK